MPRASAGSISSAPCGIGWEKHQQLSLTRGYTALIIFTAERTTVSIDVQNLHDQVSLTFPKSKLLAEGDLAVDADLIRRGAPFEKIGQLLHVLQIHERKRISRAEELGILNTAKRWSAMNSR